jgi:hypothetical protein
MFPELIDRLPFEMPTELLTAISTTRGHDELADAQGVLALLPFLSTLRAIAIRVKLDYLN